MKVKLADNVARPWGAGGVLLVPGAEAVTMDDEFYNDVKDNPEIVVTEKPKKSEDNTAKAEDDDKPKRGRPAKTEE